jgi:imidazolonepropionase-like amidohydrolase
MEPSRATRLLTLVLALSSACARRTDAVAPLVAQPAGPIVITNAVVIDPLDGPRPGMTVLIAGRRIVAVGPMTTVAIPPGAEIHDASGRYLLPGLWDAHVHLSQVGAASFALLVANGVTGVRDMGSDLRDVRRWQRARDAGQLVPRIVTPGPKLDEGSTLERWLTQLASADTRIVSSPDNARHTVAALAASGVDFVKVHNIASPALYEAIADECRRRGLTFSGHIPSGVGPVGAAAAGQRTLEHGRGMLSCSAETWARIRSDPASRALSRYCADETQSRDVLPALRRAGTWLTPTLTSWRGQLHVGDPSLAGWLAQLAGIEHVTRDLRRHWEKMAGPTPSALERELQARFGALAKAADDAGVPLLAGTDLGDPYVIPGFALHDELQLLVESGVTPLHALRSATLEPARALGLAGELGSIAPGKAADLVLLDADPLADIRNTRRIRAVVLDGRWLDASELARPQQPR